MEPDSTESSKCEAVSSENEIAVHHFPNVQSSQISSCDDNPGQTVESSTDINRTINITSSLCDETNSTEEMLQDGNERLKHLHVQNVEQPEVLLISEDQPGSSKVEEEILNSVENADNSEISESVKLTDKELEHVEESVLRKYTGLDIDLASENQLLKEDVIKCRCELEKYGKRLAAMERKLEKANNYNEDLRTQVDKLSAELHEYRREKHKVYTNSDTQTSAEDLMEVDDTLYDVNIPGAKPDGDTTFDWSAEPAADAGQTPTEGDSLLTHGMSIADSLKATAEAAMNMTGFVYDQQSGLYYDYSTGYYYNAEKGLYYDPKSGTYFYFNKSTGKYEYHSKVDLSYYTPQQQLYPERPHGSYHHGYSDKHPDRYSDRSPEHSKSSSGKKKKKKDSKRRDSDDKEPKRRDSDEKEHKKKKRKKDKSRDNSEDSDDGKKEKKKRKTSTEKKDTSEKSASEGGLKHDNVVLGELNYKKLKQGDKMFNDAMRKPKILNEKNADVSICDDVLKEDKSRPKIGLVQKGGKKIKLVLKKTVEEKKDESDTSKDITDPVEKKEQQTDDNEKESDKDKNMGKEDSAQLEEKKDESSSNDKTSNEIQNTVGTSDSQNISQYLDKQSELSGKGNNSQEIEKQNENDLIQEINDNEEDPTNPFLISGLTTDEDMISYNKVSIVNSAEILRICSELNNEDTDDENESEKDDDKEKSTNKETQPETETNPDNSVFKESETTGTKSDNGDNVTNEMLGSTETVTKLPGEEGELYSDDDDIMIIEKVEEKIMIELDSDSDDEKEISEKKSDKDSYELEPGELANESSLSSSMSSSSSSSSSENKELPPQPMWTEIVRQPEPASEESLLKNAACIRAMVTASDLLDEGMLFVVTVQGGMIGRETRNDLVIPVPDINVSKVHAEIRYNAKQQFYAIQDKGSQNGTYVNEVRISEAKHVSKWVQLKHGDTLQLSCTRFDLHIHPGTETCDKCEPGVVVQKTLPVMTSTTDSKDKKKQHREQLKNIKKKYGLTNSSYTDNTAAINNPAYQDKASERRRTVGSDNPHKLDDKPASVHRRIDGDNKGHKMLKKLGWTEGESLGKDNAGIQDPINVNIRVDKAAGLGAYGTSNSLSIENIGIVNARRRFVQTQIRFSLGTQEKNKDKQFDPLMWVQGETQDNSLINEESNKDE
ncbi:angiogenic factor with G patch and FHA domains 1-like [Mytilus trossulus]|uniref:angiogenic factor with G patch and FHA domains 1-like n=1 Tax=Mytilus trossulus TaxID=6551 RepID=UPI003004372E